MADSTNVKKSSPLLIAAAWLIVINPHGVGDSTTPSKTL